MDAHAVPRNVAVFVKSLTALIDPTAPSRRARAAGPGAQVCLGFLAAEWHNERLQSELRRRWLQVSSAQLSSMSARLHWLSMEREQGDRDGPPGGPSVMDDTAERFTALTAASVLHVLQYPRVYSHLFIFVCSPWPESRPELALWCNSRVTVSVHASSLQGRNIKNDLDTKTNTK